MFKYHHPKAKNIKKHFKNRCIQRVGFQIDENELIRKIQRNELEFVSRTSRSRSVFRYPNRLTGKEYKIVYDKLRHLVVTIYECKDRIKNG